MGSVANIGQMVQSMRANGRATRRRDTGGYYMLMVMFTRETGLTIRRKARERITIQMVLYILVNGKRTNNMALGEKSG